MQRPCRHTEGGKQINSFKFAFLYGGSCVLQPMPFQTVSLRSVGKPCMLHAQFCYCLCPPQAQLASAQVKLLSIDPTWKIENGFLMAMTDGSGANKLEQDFMDMLPTAEASKSIEAVCQTGNVLVNSKLASFASAGSVGAVKSALALLQVMQCGQPPKIPANASSFLQGVFSRLSFFAQYKGKGDNGQAKQLIGKAAVLANYHAVKQQDPNALSLKDLEQL